LIVYIENKKGSDVMNVYDYIDIGWFVERNDNEIKFGFRDMNKEIKSGYNISKRNMSGFMKDLAQKVCDISVRGLLWYEKEGWVDDQVYLYKTDDEELYEDIEMIYKKKIWKKMKKGWIKKMKVERNGEIKNEKIENPENYIGMRYYEDDKYLGDICNISAMILGEEMLYNVKFYDAEDDCKYRIRNRAGLIR